jgi:hypothetical protein
VAVRRRNLLRDSRFLDAIEIEWHGSLRPNWILSMTDSAIRRTVGEQDEDEEPLLQHK